MYYKENHWFMCSKTTCYGYVLLIVAAAFSKTFKFYFCNFPGILMTVAFFVILFVYGFCAQNDDISDNKWTLNITCKLREKMWIYVSRESIYTYTAEIEKYNFPKK